MLTKLLMRFDPEQYRSTTTSTIDQGSKAMLGKILAGRQDFDRW
jgi:hypothetical protein